MTNSEYQWFDVQRDSEGYLETAVQTQRNTAFPGLVTEQSDFILSVGEYGICINGDFGTNPTREMMHETALLLSEAVDSWRRIAAEKAPA